MLLEVVVISGAAGRAAITHLSAAAHVLLVVLCVCTCYRCQYQRK
jgi:hypothetical protein